MPLPADSQQEDPLDPERILRVLPDREHETFLAQYRLAVDDAHDPAGEDPARGGQPQERREAGLIESGSWPRAPAVIDDDPRIGSFKQRKHVR